MRSGAQTPASALVRRSRRADGAFAGLDRSRCDVAVIGAGIAGAATASRLQAAGLRTVLLESHALPGGCAGWYRRAGFSFDVGATTLVDFEPGGVGGEWLDSIGFGRVDGEALPGYVAWLPGCEVRLHRDARRWRAERLAVLGDSPGQRCFWRTLDDIAATFWRASRAGAGLPLACLDDVLRAARALGLRGLPHARYLGWTLGDLVRRAGLEDDRSLRALLAMLVEDTVHGRVETAPLVNAALGITIRGAGLTRPRGGMGGFWRRFVSHYRGQGGTLVTRCRVHAVRGTLGRFTLETECGPLAADQVVSALPVELSARIGPPAVARGLAPFLERDADARGGAIVVALGVPEDEVEGHPWTHHQLLHDERAPLGMGNNMFVSVSAPDDRESAPAGHRAVMISTHCELAPWRGLDEPHYQAQKRSAEERLIGFARRVFPRLGRRPVVVETATPRTFERFTGRPLGAVGGYRLTLANANARAIPHASAEPGFHLAGDTTWPGLGTVACVLGSRLVAERVLSHAAPRR